MTQAGLPVVGRFSLPPDHPCLPGHFPGRPLVPGVLLLDEVLALVAPRLPGTVTGMGSVKFLRPVLPGDDVEVALDAATGTWRCAVAGQAVARGQVTLAGGGDTPA